MTSLSTDPTTRHRTTDNAGSAARSRGAVAHATTLRRIVSAELLKVRTVRSTRWALVVMALAVLLVGAFSAVGAIVRRAPSDGLLAASAADPTGGALSGVGLAMYAAIAFGVLTVGGEYATGSITVSLAAVPRRGRLVWGKAIAVAAVTLVVTLVSTVATFLVARAILATGDMTISPATPGVARAVVGAALYLTVVAVLGVGFGWLLRSTAGSVAALVAVLTVLPGITALLPASVADRVLPYLPSNAGAAVLQTAPDGGLAPWTGFAVFCAYAVLTLVAALRVVRRRDA